LEKNFVQFSSATGPATKATYFSNDYHNFDPSGGACNASVCENDFSCSLSIPLAIANGFAASQRSAANRG